MCGVFFCFIIINIVLEKVVCFGDSMDFFLNGSFKNLFLFLILILYVNLLKENILRLFFRGDERNLFIGRS